MHCAGSSETQFCTALQIFFIKYNAIFFNLHAGVKILRDSSNGLFPPLLWFDVGGGESERTLYCKT